MHTHYHRDIRVDWTDGEWERLQKIKRGEYVPYPGTKKSTILASLRLPEGLKERVIEYAEDKGLSPPELVRQVLYVLTQ